MRPRALTSSSCARFSPTSVTPGLGEHAHLLGRDVLDRREDLDVLARRSRARTRARLSATRPRVEPADQLRHASPAWRPVTPRSRRWEKKRSRIARRAQAAVVDLLRRRRPRRRARATALRSSVRSLRGEHRAHVVADLVAARADAGPDGRRHRPAPPTAPTPASSTPPASPRQPAWTTPAAPGPASATGRQSATSTIAATPGRVGDLAVGLLAALAVDDDARPVHLAALREPLRAGLRAHALAVGRHALGVVVGQQRRRSATRTGPPTRRRGAW